MQELKRKQAVKEVRFTSATAENDIQVPCPCPFIKYYSPSFPALTRPCGAAVAVPYNRRSA